MQTVVIFTGPNGDRFQVAGPGENYSNVELLEIRGLYGDELTTKTRKVAGRDGRDIGAILVDEREFELTVRVGADNPEDCQAAIGRWLEAWGEPGEYGWLSFFSPKRGWISWRVALTELKERHEKDPLVLLWQRFTMVCIAPDAHGVGASDFVRWDANGQRTGTLFLPNRGDISTSPKMVVKGDGRWRIEHGGRRFEFILTSWDDTAYIDCGPTTQRMRTAKGKNLMPLNKWQSCAIELPARETTQLYIEHDSIIREGYVEAVVTPKYRKVY